MTPATATSSVWANWHWPEDVKAFAAEHGTEAYLEPLKDALARLFPTAKRARVILELDPELRDDRHVTFKVDVPSDDIPDFVKANRAWGDELFRIVPAVKVWVFRAILSPIDE
jgi:hypothetical protein